MQEDAALQGRPKLVLTRPKEPELQTSHRVRAVRVKSTAELEEEMLAKIPKFRARPFNKKVKISLHLKEYCLTLNYMLTSWKKFCLTLTACCLVAVFCFQIAEAPSFPPLPRKTPQVPEFNVCILSSWQISWIKDTLFIGWLFWFFASTIGVPSYDNGESNTICGHLFRNFIHGYC